MSLAKHIFEEDPHPIDVVESLAARQNWQYDRLGDNQIAMRVKGAWREYSLTLAWNVIDQTLRLMCTFRVDPASERLPALYELMNLVNDQCWHGAFTLWEDHDLMVFRCGLNMIGDPHECLEQVESAIADAVDSAERFYPAFHLMLHAGYSPKRALHTVIAEAFGHA